MRLNCYLLVGLVGFGRAVADFTQWMTTTCTETAWKTKAAETMWETEYSTIWSTAPAITVTSYDTVTSEKDVTKEYTTTVFDTIVDTTTQFETSTVVSEKDFTTTLVETVIKSFQSLVTTTTTQTVYESYTATVSYESDVSLTATATATALSVVTKYITLTETVASIATSLSVVSGQGYTSVLTVDITKTITQGCSAPLPPPTSTLTGIVLCPSRITNTDYTPPTPLPNNYTWGCPPGKLCKPPQIGCNFEVDLPADGYVCAPQDCITAEPLPPDFGGPYADDYNSTCPW